MEYSSARFSPPIVLSFAASDPTGGAGVQADLMTIAAMGCHPLTVITAITVQDTAGVESVLAIDADWVEEQARTLLEDMPVAAFKIGLLGSVENIAAIAGILADYPDVPVVFDPVLASGRGDPLADEEMLDALRQLLLPQTTVLTPNSLEARRLTDDGDEGGERDEGEEAGEEAPDSAPETVGLEAAAPPRDGSLSACASHLIGYGCEYVLITGTHENAPQVLNSLYGPGGLIRSDAWERLPGSYHGSGCTLASAVAAGLAAGLDVVEAVREAQDFTWRALAGAFRPGMGQFIPDRFFWARGNGEVEGD